MRKVLDSWAVLAWVKDEQPAAKSVTELFREKSRGAVDLLINVINLGEVYYHAYRYKGKPFAQSLVSMISRSVRTISADRFVMEAAEYKAKFSISYADGFALATAMREKACLVTGDPDFKNLDPGMLPGQLDVQWLERKAKPARE